MKPFLKAKTAGLPRWAWITLFSGAIIVGLYLRTRSGDDTEDVEAEGIEGAAPGSLGFYNGTESAGGLAAAGLVGPVGTESIPVQTPYLPEGVVDIIESLGTTIGELGGYIVQDRESARESISGGGLTGGGAPEAGANHEAPGSGSAPSGSSAPQCDAGTAAEICKNSREMDRLQGEINGLQNHISQLQAAINQHPKANKVNQWRNEINSDRANIDGKRAKVNEFHNRNSSLRSRPGCASVKC